MNNRDIYQQVRSFEEKFKDQTLPSLEEYLCSLWLVVSQNSNIPLTIERIADWLEQAFLITPPPFDPQWLNRQLNYEKEDVTYQDWENLILFQIADLRQMAETGLLNDKYRYLGLDSPSGARWYNFDPLTYLECGIRGSIGGYEEDEVIMLIPPLEGETADDSIYEIKMFDWKDFMGILECGQWYE